MGLVKSKNEYEDEEDSLLLNSDNYNEVYHIKHSVVIDTIKPTDNIKYKSIEYYYNNHRDCFNFKNSGFYYEKEIGTNQEVILGIIDNIKNHNEFIKIGNSDSKINKIIDYIIKDDIIIYEFENGIFLDIYFDIRTNSYHYILTTKNYSVIKILNIENIKKIQKSNFNYILIHNFIH